jgi:hypothetical protein
MYANTIDTNISVKNVEAHHFVRTEDLKILAKNVEVPKYVHTTK